MILENILKIGKLLHYNSSTSLTNQSTVNNFYGPTKVIIGPRKLVGKKKSFPLEKLQG